MALPPNELVALQRCVVREITICAVSVMIPLLQQGMLYNSKNRLLLFSAVCFPVAICLGTLGAPGLATCLTQD